MKTIKHKTSGRQYAELTSPQAGRVRVSLRTKSKKKAAALASAAGLREIEQALQAGRLSKEVITRLTHGRRITNEKAVAKWLEGATFRGESPATTAVAAHHIATWFAWRPALAKATPLDIRDVDVHEFINRPDAGGAGYRKRVLSSIRSYCRYLVDSGLAAANPARLVKINLRALPHEAREKQEWQPFEPDEARKLFDGLDLEDETQRFFLLASKISNATAMRLGDVVQLEWACLTQPGHIVVWTDKRDRRVCLPIDEEVTPGLASALGLVPFNETPYLFPEEKARYDELPRRSWFPVNFGRILQRLEIKRPGLSFHSWRHTALTRWDAQGFSLEQCADYAGHGSTKTTKGYIHKKAPSR